jgi:outer membrane protein assembly factor BamD (BamD/ComL family)
VLLFGEDVATKDQLIASAQKNLEKGQINKAIKDYQELLKLEPKVDQHKQKLADLLCRANL